MNAPPKPLLILDVDETLLFAAESPLERASDFGLGPYHVYLRPYLASFWETCAQDFELAVWSSSGNDYLEGILSRIVPDNICLAFTWSRERCVRRYDAERQEYYFVKDLKKVKRLGYDLDQVLIADDTPQKVGRNYGNAVYVRPYFGDTSDEELIHLGRYLASLSGCSNFRTVEKRGWRNHV